MSEYTKITVGADVHREAKKWSQNAFGKSKGELGKKGTWKDMQWFCRAYVNVANFWFKDPAQATLFTLRWK